MLSISIKTHELHSYQESLTAPCLHVRHDWLSVSNHTVQVLYTVYNTGFLESHGLFWLWLQLQICLSDRNTANLWILSGLWCSCSVSVGQALQGRVLFACFPNKVCKTAALFLQHRCLVVRIGEVFSHNLTGKTISLICNNLVYCNSASVSTQTVNILDIMCIIKN